ALMMTTDLFAAVSEIAQVLRPPLDVIGCSGRGSFNDAFVEMRDGAVRWRVVRERSVLALVAAPEFDRTVWYDADLLKRLLSVRGEEEQKNSRRPSPTLSALMQRSLDDVMKDLEQLRSAVSLAFDNSQWKATQQKLEEQGRRRDMELFGRPSPPDTQG